MSEYQRYEFVALDRPLTEAQMASLRAISTRPEITPTRFWNEYTWGDLKADSRKLVERYFDAHVHVTSWGSRRLILRMPKARVDVSALRPYFPGKHTARLTMAGDHALLDLVCDLEEADDEDESQDALADLTPLRAELMRGDLRPAYLAWLLAVQAEDVDEDALEPPVPAGLATLSPAQQAMVDFLRIEGDLLDAASAGSAELAASDERFQTWVADLPRAEKDRWLMRAAQEPELPLGGELLRIFRAANRGDEKGGTRTAAELCASAEAHREAREEAQRARKRAAQQAKAREEQRRQDELARDIDGAWRRLEELVAASSYEEAMKLAKDLRDLATRKGEPESFRARFDEMRKRQSRRRGFFDQWKRATTSARP